MRNIKIVTDSSANLLTLQQIPFSAAPLKVITAEREFIDDRRLDVDEMISWFESYKGRSQTSCHNPSAAEALKQMLHDTLPNVTVNIHACRGLCRLLPCGLRNRIVGLMYAR